MCKRVGGGAGEGGRGGGTVRDKHLRYGQSTGITLRVSYQPALVDPLGLCYTGLIQL